ncbi:hypothetical protein B0H17DRAFT_1242720, partial [Mycena rosella]
VNAIVPHWGHLHHHTPTPLSSETVHAPRPVRSVLAHEMRLQVERNGTRHSQAPHFKIILSSTSLRRVRVQHAVWPKAKVCLILGCYGNAIVIRHPDVGSGPQASDAGDGIGASYTGAIGR